MQRHEGARRYFLQDDCGKIIKKLLNHLAIITLRIQKGIGIRFPFASQCVLFFFDFASSKKLAAVDCQPATKSKLEACTYKNLRDDDDLSGNNSINLSEQYV